MTDPMSGCDIRLVFTLPPRDSTLQYNRCVHYNLVLHKLSNQELKGLIAWFQATHYRYSLFKTCLFFTRHWFFSFILFLHKYIIFHFFLFNYRSNHIGNLFSNHTLAFTISNSIQKPIFHFIRSKSGSVSGCHFL